MQPTSTGTTVTRNQASSIQHEWEIAKITALGTADENRTKSERKREMILIRHRPARYRLLNFACLTDMLRMG